MKSAEIEAQLQYYFSHLQTDRHLMSLVSLYCLPDISLGIPIEAMATFNKLSVFTISEIRAALFKSTDFKLSKDRTRLIPDPKYLNIDWSVLDRTLYIEHFPRTLDRHTIQFLFNTLFENSVTFVQLPLLQSSKHNKGYCFIEFANEASALYALKSINEPILSVIQDPDFENMVQKPDLDKIKSWNLPALWGLLHAFELKSMIKRKFVELQSVYLKLMHKRSVMVHIEKQHDRKSCPDFTRGILVRFANVCPGTDRNVLKAFFGRNFELEMDEDPASVDYVDLVRGEDSGIIRFKSPEAASCAVAYFSQNAIIQESVGDVIGTSVDPNSTQRIKLVPLAEDEELQQWELIYEQRLAKIRAASSRSKTENARTQKNEWKTTDMEDPISFPTGSSKNNGMKKRLNLTGFHMKKALPREKPAEANMNINKRSLEEGEEESIRTNKHLRFEEDEDEEVEEDEEFA